MFFFLLIINSSLCEGRCTLILWVHFSEMRQFVVSGKSSTIFCKRTFTSWCSVMQRFITYNELFLHPALLHYCRSYLIPMKATAHCSTMSGEYSKVLKIVGFSPFIYPSHNSLLYTVLWEFSFSCKWIGLSCNGQVCTYFWNYSVYQLPFLLGWWRRINRWTGIKNFLIKMMHNHVCLWWSLNPKTNCCLLGQTWWRIGVCCYISTGLCILCYWRQSC